MNISLLPNRFSELVELSIIDWDWDQLPDSMENIWDALMSQIFLGPTVRTAQATYIKQVLEPLICYSAAPDVNQSGWSNVVLSHLHNVKNSIRNTPNESQKRAIISLTEQDVEDLKLSRTIYDSLIFFKQNRINVHRIHQLMGDTSETENLAYSASKNIYNVALTKAVLWLYGCGIAQDLVPPNTHVVGFLNQYSCIDLGWDSSKWPPDWQLFSICRNKVNEISITVARDLGKDVSSKQVQASIWYLQTCRGLLSRGNRGKMNPDKLISYLEYQNWSIKDLEEHIVDIELLEDLEASLNSFM